MLLRGDADLLGLRAVHRDVEARAVVELVDVDVDRAGNLLELLGDLARPGRGSCRRRVPMNWMSIGAGRPKFRIWLTMSAGWKMKSVPGNSLGSSMRSLRW